MILAPLVGLSLLVAAATDDSLPVRPDGVNLPFAAVQLSERQKKAAFRPLLESATRCVARAVAADPRYGPTKAAAEINELIVDLMPACAEPMGRLIEAHDRLYGLGSGEGFFMGPYLDELPAAVDRLIQRTRN
jgi:hypothetical protein